MRRPNAATAALVVGLHARCRRAPDSSAVGGRHVEALGAEPGPAAAHGGEQLFAERLEDRPGDDARRASLTATDVQASGHAVGDSSTSRRAGRRARSGRASVGAATALLAEDRVLREVPRDHPLDLCLGGEVDGGDDRRPVVLVGHLDRPAELFDEHDARGAGRG